MSIKGLVTRGFGLGLGVIKEVVLRGFQPSPEPPPPPQYGDPIDYDSLSAYFVCDTMEANFVCDTITVSFSGQELGCPAPVPLGGFNFGFDSGFDV